MVAFDTEEFKGWRRAYVKRLKPMPNVVRVLSGGRDTGQTVLVVIAPGLYKYLSDVHKADTLEGYSLYVDNLNGGYLFGYETPDGSMVDLWRYTQKALPSWLNPRIDSERD